MLNTTTFPLWMKPIQEAHEAAAAAAERQAQADEEYDKLKEAYIFAENQKRARPILAWLGIDILEDAVWSHDGCDITQDGYTFMLEHTFHEKFETDKIVGSTHLLPANDPAEQKIRLTIKRRLPAEFVAAHGALSIYDRECSPLVARRLDWHLTQERDDTQQSLRVEIGRRVAQLNQDYDAIVREWPGFIANIEEAERKREQRRLEYEQEQQAMAAERDSRVEIATTPEERLMNLLRDVIRDVLAEQREY